MLKVTEYLNELQITIKKKRTATPAAKSSGGYSVSPAAQAALDKAEKAADSKPIRRGKEYVFEYKGKWVIDTKHAAERVIERGTLTRSEMQTLFKRMIDSKPADDGSYLFSSKSLNQTLVVGVRPDYRSGSDESQFIIITFLPRGKHHSNSPKDIKVMMESLELDVEIDYSVELD